jgi:hypothetical protein
MTLAKTFCSAHDEGAPRSPDEGAAYGGVMLLPRSRCSKC